MELITKTKLALTCFALMLTQGAIATPAETASAPGFVPTSFVGFFDGSYGSLSADWWQWSHSLSKSINPIMQNGSIDCSLGQHGHTWFLAGTMGGIADRNCSVPHHAALFFPLVNIEDINGPGDCGRSEGCTVAEKRQKMGAVMDTACDLSSTLDGAPTVFSYSTVRTQTPPYDITIGSDDVFGIPAGIKDSEAIADGYWVLIPYLTKGSHELHIKGSVCDPATHAPAFTTEVTYHLNVK